MEDTQSSAHQDHQVLTAQHVPDHQDLLAHPAQLVPDHPVSRTNRSLCTIKDIFYIFALSRPNIQAERSQAFGQGDTWLPAAKSTG